MSPKRRKSADGQVPAAEEKQRAAREELEILFRRFRAEVVGPLRAILRDVMERGGDPEATLRAMAEGAGLEAEDATGLLRFARRVRSAVGEHLGWDAAEGAQELADHQDLAPAGEALGELVKELDELVAVLDELEAARVEKADGDEPLDPAAQREVNGIMAALGCDRAEARRILQTADPAAAFEAARKE